MSDSFKNVFAQGVAAFEQGNYDEAATFLKEAKSMNTDDSRVFRVLGNCLRLLGKVDEAISVYREGLQIKYDLNTHQRLINTLNYSDEPPSLVALEHKKWAEAYTNHYVLKYKLSLKPRSKHLKIRIGYVSPDFNAHPVAYFLLPIIQNHNKDIFEIFCYANINQEDGVTHQFKLAADRWIDIRHMSTVQLFDQIQQDAIDILIDVAGLTSGNRLDVFALRAAPVQVTYLGYPGTTGLKTMDYRLVDSISDPQNGSDEWHSEKLYRLPDCFLCFRLPPENLKINDAPCQSKSFVTFGTFNKISKITDRTIALWVQILQAVPDSKFVLKGRGFEKKVEQNRIKKRFASAGLEQIDRLVLYGFSPKRSEHLLLYNELDIALDTFPYNGTTTTMQAIFMGVPVIALDGKSHVARVSQSILSAIGANELVAIDEEDYFIKAVHLANDKERIARYKKELRSMLENSPIRNEINFIANLEEAYRKMLREKQLRIW
ncbi:MAG: tetratricopeptide repeat protein [Methylomicrobium sp.]|nr:tetratricopeptide repeat protein [Methylomicrobium sp.]